MYEFLKYKLAQFLALSLPLGIGYSIAAVLAKAHFRTSKKDRAIVIENLRVVLNDQDDTTIRRYAKSMFVNFAKYLVDFFRFKKLDKRYLDEKVEISGKENLDSALKRGRGVILLAAHIGNYELGAAIISLLGYPINVVALDHKNRLVNNFFVRQRQLVKINVIPLGAALRKCYEALESNQLLALVGDRDFSHHGLVTKFFGRDALIPKGAAALSLRTGALIIPTFFVRMAGDKFKLIFEKQIPYSPTGDLDNDVRQITDRCVRAIEDCVRRYPYQWFMFARFWI